MSQFFSQLNSELTIVIPTENEEKEIPRVFHALMAQDYPLMRSTQVLLVDNDSKDKTTLVAHGFWRQICVEAVPGGDVNSSRNTGARLAKGKYILFIDTDTRLGDPTLIRRTVEHAKNRELLCVIGRRIQHRGSFVLFDRDEFFRVGGFDESAEDIHASSIVSKIHSRSLGIVASGPLSPQLAMA